MPYEHHILDTAGEMSVWALYQEMLEIDWDSTNCTAESEETVAYWVNISYIVDEEDSPRDEAEPMDNMEVGPGTDGRTRRPGGLILPIPFAHPCALPLTVITRARGPPHGGRPEVLMSEHQERQINPSGLQPCPREAHGPGPAGYSVIRAPQRPGLCIAPKESDVPQEESLHEKRERMKKRLGETCREYAAYMTDASAWWDSSESAELDRLLETIAGMKKHPDNRLRLAGNFAEMGMSATAMAAMQRWLMDHKETEDEEHTF